MRKFLSISRVAAIVTALLITAAPPPVDAQQRSGGSTGGSGSGSMTGSASGAGSTTGGTTGTSTAGGSTSARSGRQAGTTGQGIDRPQLESFGSTQNQNRSTFTGPGASNTFVGQQQLQQQNARAAFAAQFGGLGAQFGAFGNPGTQTTARGTGQTTTRTRAERLRPRHRVAFSFTPIAPAATSTRLQSLVRPLQADGRLRDVELSIDEAGTVILRGTAATLEDRELAAAIARLEPGVRRVDNQILVTDATAAPADLP